LIKSQHNIICYQLLKCIKKNKINYTKTIIILLILCTVLLACNENKPKLENKKESTQTVDSLAKDTSKVLIAELPIHFANVDYLIHPIGFASIARKSGRSISSLSYSSDGYSDGGRLSVNYDRNDCFTGSISNLVFEEMKTRTQTLLTKKIVLISSVTYLKEIYSKTKRQYLLYILADKDTNGDGVITNADFASVYLSRTDGTELKKVSIDGHLYHGGELIAENLKYYFKTQEDTNKDGVFDSKDKLHYFYLDFSSDPYRIVEYFPLKLIVK